MREYNDVEKLVVNELHEALSKVDDHDIDTFISDLLCADRVFFTGVGRVFLSLQAFAKRLSHLGISAHCVGDINEPAITENSLLVVGSGSGCSIVPVAIAKKAKEYKYNFLTIVDLPGYGTELFTFEK